jgi:negative regulator of flagellin synthesis FlgM
MMKVSSSSLALKPTAAAGVARTGAVGKASAAASTSTSVATDPTARLSQLETHFAQSDFNAAKVNQISSDIAAGRYQVDAGAVADKLLASAANLGAHSPGSAS